ncbi:hypothetical protein B0H11DRAFT_2215502 [Mycena galericulata]|nr:hypothetical protein B0H11DRAFT_2215502 [Mycena galericulata]
MRIFLVAALRAVVDDFRHDLQAMLRMRHHRYRLHLLTSGERAINGSQENLRRLDRKIECAFLRYLHALDALRAQGEWRVESGENGQVLSYHLTTTQLTPVPGLQSCPLAPWEALTAEYIRTLPPTTEVDQNRARRPAVKDLFWPATDSHLRLPSGVSIFRAAATNTSDEDSEEEDVPDLVPVDTPSSGNEMLKNDGFGI